MTLNRRCANFCQITINGSLGISGALADQATPTGQVDPATRYVTYDLGTLTSVEFIVYDQIGDKELVRHALLMHVGSIS